MTWCAVLFLAACSQDTATIESREEQDPLMVRAQARKSARDIDGAIELYQQAIAEKPDLAKAHLHLGLLYEEHRKDYLRAIYHYETYLELRPDTDKRAFIEELVRGARMYYAASLPDRPSEAIEALSVLQAKLEGAEAELAAARQENDQLRTQLRDARQAAVSGAARPPAARPAATRAAASGGESVYVVRAGDTLSRIAREVYGDSNKWKLIYEANGDALRRPEDLREGQVLRIPRG